MLCCQELLNDLELRNSDKNGGKMWTPDMAVKVTISDFHRTHEKAGRAEGLVGKGAKTRSVKKLRQALAELRAAQDLSNAETGPDRMYAASYREEIKKVEAELRRRRVKRSKR
jgi:hypothetical protein